MYDPIEKCIESFLELLYMYKLALKELKLFMIESKMYVEF